VLDWACAHEIAKPALDTREKMTATIFWDVALILEVLLETPGEFIKPFLTQVENRDKTART
jgi:hypothetical protein